MISDYQNVLQFSLGMLKKKKKSLFNSRFEINIILVMQFFILAPSIGNEYKTNLFL